MNYQETLELLSLARAALPAGPGFDLEPTAQVWQRLLADLPAPLASAALERCLASSDRFPTPASLRNAATELWSGAVPTWAEAWKEVRQAVLSCGYSREREALDSMHPIAAHTARCLGWRDICLAENTEVVKGQFRMAYDQLARRYEQERSLPAHLGSGALPLPTHGPDGSHPALVAFTQGHDDTL